MPSETDNKNYLLSSIAFLVAVILALIFCLAPQPGVNGDRFYAFFFECIPDAFVALIAIPVLYWLFIRRGIHGLAVESPISKSLDKTAPDSSMPIIAAEIAKAAAPAVSKILPCAILIVVDVQNDFITGALPAYKASRSIQAINNAIRIAESRGMLIVFTKDWHPEDHWSFKKNKGPYETHCVHGTHGAELSDDLHVPPDSVMIHFGVKTGDVGYSALENKVLETLVAHSQIESVYVVGIALNYCVLSTCVSVAELGKKTFAIEDAIASADGDTVANEKVWAELERHGVVRLSNVVAFADRTGPKSG
jgi:nicotinamidase/pyrazinamidase